MAFESEFNTEISQSDNLHRLVQEVIAEITETFKQIQTAASRRKTILIREVSIIEDKLRRQRKERREDVKTLVRARESLEEVLNSNKYKELKQDLLLRLDDSLERENDRWKRDEFGFISTGLTQLKECIAKFGNISQNGREEDLQAFDDDTHLSLPMSHLASPRLPRKFRWQDVERASLSRQSSTPSYQLPVSSTLPRPMTSHRLSDVSPLYQAMGPFEISEGIHNARIPRKNSYNHRET